MTLSFPSSITQQPISRVLWGLHARKATGLFVLEWDQYRKEILWESGLPLAVMTNFKDEAMGPFLIQKGLITYDEVEAAMKKKSEAKDSGLMVIWLMKEGFLKSQEVPQLIEEQLRLRIFSPLKIVNGDYKFKTMASLPPPLLKNSDGRLTEPFANLMWSSIQKYYSKDFVEKQLGTSFRFQFKEKLPFPLGPQELRFWKAGLTSPINVSEVEPGLWHILKAASDFQLIEIKESKEVQESALLQEMRALYSKIKDNKPHEIFQLDLDAPVTEFKARYLSMVKKYHPDRLGTQTTPEAKQLAESLNAIINEAFKTVSDPVRKQTLKDEIALEDQGGMEGVHEQLEIEMVLSQVEAALKRKHLGQAVELLDSLKKSSSVEVELYRRYCDLMMKTEKGDPLKEDAEKYLLWMESPEVASLTSARLSFFKGIVYRILGQWNESVEAFEKAIKLDASLTEAQTEIRVIKLKLEKNPKKSWFKK